MQEPEFEIPISYPGMIGFPAKRVGCATTTNLLNNLEQALEISRGLPWYWFRGHDRVFGELTPSIFRRLTVFGASAAEHFTRSERTAYFQFRRQAPAHLEHSMLPTDALSWLMLMQHHGCPTRLLDWSESVLIALYFAVRDRDRHNEDAEMWAMFPPMLNEISTSHRGLPPAYSPHLVYLAEEAWYPGHRIAQLSALIQQEWGRPAKPWYEKPPGPIAFEPPMAFPRLVAQRSVFTIHPNPYMYIPCWEQKGDAVRSKPVQIARPPTIVDLLSESNGLVRYVIPSRSKETMLRDLATLGYSERTLFMSLDGLGADVRREIGSGGQYQPRIPPTAGGPWPVRYHAGWPGL